MRRLVRDNWKPTTILALTAALFVPLLVFGGPAFARSGNAASSQYEYPSASQYKLTICHHTGSKKHPWVRITISTSAWPAHRRHGDVLPPCPAANGSKKSAHAKHGVSHGKSKTTHPGNPSQGSSSTHGNSGHGKH